MNTDGKEIVTALRAALADRVGRDRYEVWFGPRTRMAIRNGSLIVAVPSRFHQDWLRANFRKDLETASLETLGQHVELEFRVEASLAATQKQTAAAKPQTASVAQREKKVEALPRRRNASLSTFVVGPSNCVAHKTAQLAHERPGEMSPLLVHGPTGVGKTHLLEGILSDFRRTRAGGGSSALYLSAEQFTTCFLDALRGGGLPSFRRKCRDVEVLMLDDVQFFAGKRATLVELLHTIDALLREGRQMVFAADRAPAGLKALGPELMARLSGGVVCRIDPPDFQVRLGIVRHFAAQLEMVVSQDVEQWIASQFTSQNRELGGALKRLQANSLALGRPITLALAEEVLAELIDHSGHVVRLPDIERAICGVFGLQPDTLQSNRKAKTVSYPRMLAMWLARKHTRAALSEIGHFFGRRSHSTVVAAQKKINRLMAKGAPLEMEQGVWKLEETIRRVEEQLRAG